MKYVSENMTFIMCFYIIYTCNVFWVGVGSKGNSTGVRIVKRASKNYCIFWGQKSRRVLLLLSSAKKPPPLLQTIYIYRYCVSVCVFSFFLYIFEGRERERDRSFCHIYILDWVFYYLLVPIIYMYVQIIRSLLLYIFEGIVYITHYNIRTRGFLCTLKFYTTKYMSSLRRFRKHILTD